MDKEEINSVLLQNLIENLYDLDKIVLFVLWAEVILCSTFSLFPLLHHATNADSNAENYWA